MKPWEGKHWKEYEEEYGKSYTLYNGRESIQAATIALKKDWEEQQKEQTCAQTAESQKTNGHQELFERGNCDR